MFGSRSVSYQFAKNTCLLRRVKDKQQASVMLQVDAMVRLLLFQGIAEAAFFGVVGG